MSQASEDPPSGGLPHASSPQAGRRPRATRIRIPAAQGDLQVNHCRNPNCANFGIPARSGVPRGRRKGHVVVREFPGAETASCRNPDCENHTRTLAAAPEQYSPDRSGWNAWSQRWRCKRCGKYIRVAMSGAPPPPKPDRSPRDLYRAAGPELHCHNCKEFVNLRSNHGIVEEVERLSSYLAIRRGPSCPTSECVNRERSVEDDDAGEFYHAFGNTRAGSKRYRCKSCKTVFSVARPTAGQRQSEVNIRLFKLLLSRISLTKIANFLEISRPAVYDKIDFLQERCRAFLGERERALSGRKFDELLLSTDRQAYLCNWSRAVDARFIMLHTLAHAMIKELTFSCGYGSSSLRERLYCNLEDPQRPMNGILIYTASGDSEGTLGGLVAQAAPGRLDRLVDDALRRTSWCSNDPVCIESPDGGAHTSNLAACHGCILLPETSCEEGNRLLDRALLIGTIEDENVGRQNGQPVRLAEGNSSHGVPPSLHVS
jgi:transposase-like protein